MAELQRLLTLLKELDDQLAGCMKCGMCQAVCPLYAETGREMDVARGKLVLVEHLSSQLLNDPQGVQKRLERCLLCGSCAKACPSGVPVVDIFIKARAIIGEYLGLPPIKKLIFRSLLPRPRLMDGLQRLAAAGQGLFSKKADPILGSSCARFNAPVIRDRHYLPLATTPLHGELGEIDEPAGPGGTKVGFYPGCLVDKIFLDLGRDAIDVLRHRGHGIFVPGEQVCCGIPALSSGDRQGFERLVGRILNQFEDADIDYLITPCATCTATIRTIWPLMAEYLPQREQQRVRRLAEKTRDITEFLAEGLDETPGETQHGSGEKTGITYHDPCHLQKTLSISQAPRRLIGANSNYDFREMGAPDRCCGMGGSFNLLHYDLSRQVGQKKAEDILATGADTVATACPACMIQLVDQLSRTGKSIRVAHAVQIYAETLPQRAQKEQS
ncbi:MAG: (Fe-S)-binding protein [Desulfohalobiaceae bacterium]|nr:(Fe-S)-binding protein [Desulfohalobiaceae bacterium]